MPVSLIIEKANETSIESISKKIADAKNKKLTNNEIVLQKKRQDGAGVLFSSGIYQEVFLEIFITTY